MPKKDSEFASNMKTLKINHAESTCLYSVHFKHSHYFSPLSCSLRDKSSDELHEVKDLSLDRNTLQITLPEIISDAFKWTTEPDPSSQLIRETNEYNKLLLSCRGVHKRKKESLSLEKIRRKTGKTMQLPRYLIELALKRPPCTFFQGDYDYRYTGGTISTMQYNHNNMLASAKRSKLVLTSLKGDKKSVHPYNSQIFNVETYNFNNATFLTLRLADCALIQEVRQPENSHSAKISFKTLLASKPCVNEPIIDVKMMSHSKIIHANVAQNVQLLDLRINKEIYTKMFAPTPSSYDLCQIALMHNNEDEFVFMDRSRIQLVDLRAGLEANCNALKLIDGFFSCNALCTLCVSDLDSLYIYVASKHNVYKCDIRVMQIVKKWPHFLDHSPIAIKCVAGVQEEVLFIASLYETVCLTVSPNANYLPFKVPSIEDAFDEYNFYHEVVLDHDMQARCKLSTVGIDVYSRKGIKYLFTANSIGDVFQQRLVFNSSEGRQLDNSREMDAMQEFIANSAREEQLNATHFKDLSDLHQKIANTSNQCENEQSLQWYEAPNSRMADFVQPDKFARYAMADIWNTQRVNVPVPAAAEKRDTLVGKWLQDKTNRFHDDF